MITKKIYSTKAVLRLIVRGYFGAIIAHGSFCTVLLDQTAAHCKQSIGDTVIIGEFCTKQSHNYGENVRTVVGQFQMLNFHFDFF